MPILGIIASSKKASPPVSGYTLWLDAADASVFTYSSGTIVSQWTDKSGNNYNFTQATLSFQPDRQNNVQNGLPSVVFNADFLINTLWDWSVIAFTVFAVIKNRSNPNYDAFLSREYSALALGYDNTNKFAIHRAGFVTSASNLINTGSNADVAVWKSAGVSSGNISVDFYKNGTAGSAALTLTSVTAGTRTLLGALYDNTTDPIVGHISELLIYPSELSDTNRNSVEAYLKTKWGTP